MYLLRRDASARVALLAVNLRGHARRCRGKGRLGISRRSTGAISLWNSSSVARCCFLVRPSPSAFTWSTSCPICPWYQSTLSMICCGLPIKAELRSMASSERVEHRLDSSPAHRC